MPAGSRLRGQHCRRPVSCRAAFFFQRPRPSGSNPRPRFLFEPSFANSDPFLEPFHLHELQPLASLRHRRLEVSPTRRRVKRRLRHAAEFGKLRDCVVRLRLPLHLRPPFRHCRRQSAPAPWPSAPGHATPEVHAKAPRDGRPPAAADLAILNTQGKKISSTASRRIRRPSSFIA